MTGRRFRHRASRDAGEPPDAERVRRANPEINTVENFQSRARQLTPSAIGRTMPEEGLLSQLKQLIVGKPIPSHLAHHERLSRFTGLAVLSSDPLSSVAYATEEILRVLILVGVGALSFSSPIAFVIATILAVVVFSYRQTIHAYPSGGGAYIVAKDNLGETPALIAAGALLIDYVLTVAVSIAAGVAAITSAFPEWHLNRVEMTLGFVVVLTLGNLRGIRESGRIFALPTYFFVVSLLALIAAGAWRALNGTHSAGRGRRSDRANRPGVDDVPAAYGVLERLHGDDRRRGGVERRARIQATRGEERRRDDADDGGAVDHDVRRDHAAGAGVPRDAERARDRRLADRARRLRRARACRTTSCRPRRC